MAEEVCLINSIATIQSNDIRLPTASRSIEYSIIEWQSYFGLAKE